MNIIVTGASKGIGYQTVLHLAQTGDHQILAISRNKEGLENLQSAFKIRNKSKLYIESFDLAQKDYSLITHRIIEVFGLDHGNYLDVLVNNAGYLCNQTFMETHEDEWLTTFSINLFSVVKLIKQLYPYFNRTEGSHIVNIGSMGGIQGSEKFPGLSAYSASKGALNILTESLAREFENENIKVNAINPGAVQTEMFEKAFPGHKAMIKPEEIAAHIAHFSVHAHKYMNGRINQVSLK
jgi:3-oxoacyl-[acyl-carrier protein] reductase